MLMAGHGRRAVVKDDHRSGRLVIDHIHKRIDAGVHKGGIPDDGDPVADIFFPAGFLHTVERRDRRPHAERGVDHG